MISTTNFSNSFTPWFQTIFLTLPNLEEASAESIDQSSISHFSQISSEFQSEFLDYSNSEIHDVC